MSGKLQSNILTGVALPANQHGEVGVQLYIAHIPRPSLLKLEINGRECFWSDLSFSKVYRSNGVITHHAQLY